MVQKKNYTQNKISNIYFWRIVGKIKFFIGEDLKISLLIYYIETEIIKCDGLIKMA